MLPPVLEPPVPDNSDTFPLCGLVFAPDVLVNDFVHVGLTGYRVTLVVPYADGTTLIEGVMPGGGRAHGVHPQDAELEVTRLVDDNLEPS